MLRGEKLTREEPGVHISNRSTVPVTDPAPQKTEEEKVSDTSAETQETQKKDEDTGTSSENV